MAAHAPASELSGTQASILSAYAELIEEVGTDDVSFRVIALRAGVGERTVFRYYPTRVDLLLATSAWIERTIFTRAESGSIFDVPLAIREAMEAYERRPELAYVVAETAMRGSTAPTRRRSVPSSTPCCSVRSRRSATRSGGTSSRRCATSTPRRPG